MTSKAGLVLFSVRDWTMLTPSMEKRPWSGGEGGKDQVVSEWVGHAQTHARTHTYRGRCDRLADAQTQVEVERQ